MIDIAVVEDDVSDADKLEEYLNRFSAESGQSIQICRFDNAVSFLEKYTPRYDIVFMDIDMPMLSGMNASRRLREMDGNVTLIFVTNLVQYAVDGYEVAASDFIVKPINYYGFSIRLRRALEKIDRSSGVSVDVRTREKFIRLSAQDIKYVEVFDHDLVYHTEKERITAIGSLSDIESTLKKVGFFRCSRCYLVNLKYVLGVRGTSVNVGGEEIRISSSRRKALMSALTDWLSGKGSR